MSGESKIEVVGPTLMMVDPDMAAKLLGAERIRFLPVEIEGSDFRFNWVVTEHEYQNLLKQAEEQFGMVPKKVTLVLKVDDLGVIFVNEGEKVLFDLKDPVKFMKLREKIDRVRSRQDIITERVEDWDAYISNL
jgi:hypothetical protein